ncbi:hypothetical protein TA05_00540 [Citrobacter rodentium]|nr:hypothetical protein TA05_00540 [Citrobacter rodentium]
MSGIINKEKTSAENNKNNSDKTSVIHKAPLSVIAPKTKDTIDAITRINTLIVFIVLLLRDSENFMPGLSM